jgi:hypothetical protein
MRDELRFIRLNRGHLRVKMRGDIEDKRGVKTNLDVRRKEVQVLAVRPTFRVGGQDLYPRAASAHSKA